MTWPTLIKIVLGVLVVLCAALLWTEDLENTKEINRPCGFTQAANR